MWRATHSSMERYALEKWGMPRATYHRAVQAGEVIESLLAKMAPEEEALREVVERHRDEKALAKLRASVPERSWLAVYRIAANYSRPHPPASEHIARAISPAGLLPPRSDEELEAARETHGAKTMWEIQSRLASGAKMNGKETKSAGKQLRVSLRNLGIKSRNRNRRRKRKPPQKTARAEALGLSFYYLPTLSALNRSPRRKASLIVGQDMPARMNQFWVSQ